MPFPSTRPTRAAARIVAWLFRAPPRQPDAADRPAARTATGADTGFTIRVQWRRGGQHVHQFHGFFREIGRAWRARTRLIRFLDAGPNRPSDAYVVAVSRREFDWHHPRTRCRLTDCAAIDVADHPDPSGPGTPAGGAARHRPVASGRSGRPAR
ncbi:hypothetical protein [Plantactinospora sp. KBS50]|uniref:hypothetical protein n=1 Tax=Plantactinospora sp. KBS50 TaxID=2024580 RepID=UPI000BAADE34|nr:hypothetical protein [Plantactinospora sp. KBS50]ASW55336.1 hypothetical protein CIK06_15905 [Plantactinospora sp. KBS50]